MVATDGCTLLRPRCCERRTQRTKNQAKADSSSSCGMRPTFKSACGGGAHLYQSRMALLAYIGRALHTCRRLGLLQAASRRQAHMRGCTHTPIVPDIMLQVSRALGRTRARAGAVPDAIFGVAVGDVNIDVRMRDSCARLEVDRAPLACSHSGSLAGNIDFRPNRHDMDGRPSVAPQVLGGRSRRLSAPSRASCGPAFQCCAGRALAGPVVVVV